jgi:hypothetical protein
VSGPGGAYAGLVGVVVPLSGLMSSSMGATSGCNLRDRGSDRTGGGEREPNKILFKNRSMSQNQNPGKPLCKKLMKALSNSRNMIPPKL